jgi:hypothetical protein
LDIFSEEFVGVSANAFPFLCRRVPRFNGGKKVGERLAQGNIFKSAMTGMLGMSSAGRRSLSEKFSAFSYSSFQYNADVAMRAEAVYFRTFRMNLYKKLFAI